MSVARTLRAVGVAVVADQRAVDLALVETDGADHVRLVECERQPLQAGPLLPAVVHAVRVFMGDRTLQPFALDYLALAVEAADMTAAGLGIGVETYHCVIPTVTPSTRGSSLAERVAFAAITASLDL